MESFETGEVVLLPFSYTDLQSSKRRPAVVLLDAGDEDILIAKVTTKQYDSPYDIPLKEWKQAGLFAPSIARLHKLLAVEKIHVIQRLGRLNPTDLRNVQKAFRSMI
jgi:mRNA interferase MazF